VARRPKIRTEISKSASGSIKNRKLEECVKFCCQAARPPLRHIKFTSFEIVPHTNLPDVPIVAESHKSSKPAKSALHVCAERGSNKNKPRAG
jgi:hypothetical protein